MSKKTKKRVIIFIILILFIYVQFFPYGHIYSSLNEGTNYYDYRVKSLVIQPYTGLFCYKTKEDFHNKNDIIDFFKEYEYDPDYNLEYGFYNFMDENGTVNWDEVSQSIHVTYWFWKKTYTIKYNVGYHEYNWCILKITSDGYIYDKRSQGK